MTLADDLRIDRPALRRRSPWSLPTDLAQVVMFGLLAFLLVEVLFESWLRVVLAERALDTSGHVFLQSVPTWPQTARNGVYIVLAVLTGWVVLRRGRLREFTTAADIALGVLLIALVLAGILGDSSAMLTGQGVFVYLRGVVVFYAIRALDPPRPYVRAVLWVVGSVIVLNAVVSVVQLVVGRPSYAALGWVDFEWADVGRAQALQDHPNHLGQLVGLMLLGMLAWFVTARRVLIRWWVIFTLLALSLAATQSRESVVGMLLGILVIGLLRRGRIRVFAGSVAIIVVLIGAVWVGQPSNWAELSRRVAGVANAIRVPSGAEEGVTCRPPEDCTSAGLPHREIRVLYIQQGIELWLDRPIFGYGVGQFGGAVAYQDDPLWNMDPRFGPGGFDMHGFAAKQVDSFWLHLLVETGAVGSLAYLVWYALLGIQLVRSSQRHRVPSGVPDEDATWGAVAALWGSAALALSVVLAVFSPALEDSLFPPLLFGVVGLGWVNLHRRGRISPVPVAAEP